MNGLLHFLVTESSLGARIVIRSQLMQLGHSVDMALDGESTLVLVELKTYHLILLDAELNKGFDCYELGDMIHQSTFNRRTPIILLSASPHKTLKKSLYPCFAKPMNVNDVNKIIDYLEEYNKNR
ncbi:TPA: response regulator [Legionella pneumophila]|uniref:Response regulator receiver n=1 Tax=Legionella erythra TaxID=448 RepID=A0A0W0TJ43_LEGER|nr:response regulator [Legionella erythra]HAT6349374.1 response regulator [Legionella pneumophila]KTC95606.1 Response regulator receiver [Legionella erythra]HAU0381389.1 response regulator [Legionella pneumophila]HAU0422410.1 response regulator [Legionella pneumophila]HAU0424806.1 response regulator [Legionella pneumophila]